MVRQQDGAAAEARDLVEVPSLFLPRQRDPHILDVDGIMVAVAGVHRDELPGAVLAAQRKVAGLLADRRNHIVVGAPTCVHVVIAGQTEDTHGLRAPRLQDLGDGREEIIAAFGCRT